MTTKPIFLRNSCAKTCKQGKCLKSYDKIVSKGLASGEVGLNRRDKNDPNKIKQRVIH